MEEFLNNVIANNNLPIWSAFALGLMTAISPCPLATNITAMGFISKDFKSRRRVLMNGLVYTLGRVFSYTFLAFIIFIGADQFKISGVFQQYGEKLLGPLLVIIGLFMLGFIRFNLPQLFKFSDKFQQKSHHSFLDVFFLGVVFALAFCPYSGVLYFGILIPMTIQSVSGLYLPVVFALATGIPVLVFAWLLAYTVSGVGRLYNQIKLVELWFRRLVALLFISIGVYYSVIVWI